VCAKKNNSKSGSRSTKGAGSRSTGKAGKAAGSASKSSGRGNAPERAPLIDERAAGDIWGIILITTGIVLGLAVILTQTGVVAEFIAMGLGLIMGIGRFFLPFALLILGLSFFVPVLRFAEVRIAVGLAAIWAAFIGIVGLSAVTPEAATPFESAILQSHGGYIGNAIAWALHALLGTAISYVILIALAVVGLIITGVSLSTLLEWLGDRRYERAEEKAHREAEKAMVQPKTVKVSPKAQPALADSRPTGKRKRPGANTLDEDDQPTVVIDEHDPFDDTEYDAGDAQTQVLDSGEAKTEVIEEKSDTQSLAQNITAPRALEGFVLPSLDLLNKTPKCNSTDSPAAMAQQQKIADSLVDTLRLYDVESQVVDWIVGPTVTLYKLEIERGTRLNKVTALADDLAMALAATTLRILAPIPGESLVGIEVPNADRSSVTLGDLITPADSKDGPLELFIGQDISGASISRNLASMPHLLIGGSTGSGKSVAINTMIMSMLMRTTPAEVRMILIDPKRVELSMFNDLPHLFTPVVTTPKEAAAALNWACNEMDRRLKLMEKARVRNIGEYNQALHQGKLKEDDKELPYLVIVIDELADLMMVAAKEVEASIVRIAQLARAAGIHLIVATQRPDANVVTSLIKANITNRIAFRTATAIDSRVILDSSGAEQLTGLGDMLFSIPAWPSPKRIQGCYVSETEIEAVVASIKEQSDEVEYDDEVVATLTPGAGSGDAGSGGEDDPLIWEAAESVINAGFGSTSGIQRRFKVGYSRAGRIMDMLQSKGIVGPPDGSKPREVLIDAEGLARLMAGDDPDAEYDDEDNLEEEGGV